MPKPQAQLPGMLLQVTVAPSGWEPGSPAAVRATPAVPRGGREPSRPRWDPARPAGTGTLASLFFSAVDQGGALAGWHAAYLDPGAVDASRARAMSTVLASVDALMRQAADREGAPPDFTAYLGRAARALGIEAPAPFAVRMPGHPGLLDGAWRQVDARGLRGWLGTRLAEHRDAAAAARREPAGQPDLGTLLAGVRRDSPAGAAVERLLAMRTARCRQGAAAELGQ